MPHEDNPFLGERGIRLQLNRPELLRTQLRAILRTAGRGDVRVMFPMIATLSEWRMAKAALDEEAESLGVAPIQAGIMIEVPSAAIQAEVFAREVDFFSIGTNDLTQYTLAMDRGHPKLGSQMDGLNPAVLRLIASTVKAAHDNEKVVGVCGGLASDLAAVPILMGLGVDELSASLPTIPGVKALVRARTIADCETLARQAQDADTAEHVRALTQSTPDGINRSTTSKS
jgi:multiphosphoryl transfer protein